MQNAEEARAIVFTIFANERYFGDLEYKNIAYVYRPPLIFSSHVAEAKKMTVQAGEILAVRTKLINMNNVYRTPG